MSNQELGILKRYSHEILSIKNRLKDLENNRIYEFTSTRNDGSLPYNAQKIIEELEELLVKIDKQAPSVNDQLNEVFKKE